MIALAHTLVSMPHLRVLNWANRAFQRVTWRHVVLVIALQAGRELFGPLGGVFFLPVPVPQGFLTRFLDGSWFVGGAAIIYCVLVADEAFEDGVPPWRAYGLAVISFSLLVPITDWGLSRHFGWRKEEAPQIAWWAQVLLFQGGLGTSIYAYWRVTQRSIRWTQAAETERLRNEQRVQASRLLALQARVEPQMLFDSLGRVAALHLHEPQAADALLEDLIALLRAMQPLQTTGNSTVEREFALVEAWLRVDRRSDQRTRRVTLRMTPESRLLGIAPMLVLPMLRAALMSRRAEELDWVLSAEATGARLIVILQSSAGMDAAGVAASQELASLHERLSRLFGRSAGLTVLPHIPSLNLDLPRLQEDPDDDRSDR